MGQGVEKWVGRQGGCLCGAIRYEVTEPPMALLACHCTDCQRRGGGAMSLSMPLPETGVRLLQGTPVKQEERIEDRVKTSDFCDVCHTRLFVRNTAGPGMVILKAGTLDDCSDLRPVAHLWVRSKQPWVQLPPDVLSFEMQPPMEAFAQVAQAWAAQHQAEADNA